MKIDDFSQNFLIVVKVELHQNFDGNFERKAFFTQRWASSPFPNRKGSRFMRTGTIRRSINAKVQGMNIVFYSSVSSYK